jgi:hypothetical protein
MATTRLGKERAIVATRLGTRSEVGSWVLPGAVMGVAAGGVFLIFEMIAAGIMGQSAFEPFRMIAAVILGEGALPAHSTIGLAAVVPVALAIHYALSAFYGGVFGAVVGAIGTLRSGHVALAGAASVFGFVLWLANFGAIAPALFPWFLMADPAVQFIAHTLFFGTPLGLMLGIRLRGEQRGTALGRGKV